MEKRKRSRKRVLIITADDFGYCPKRDRGIFELFLEKKISRTSVLLSGYSSRHALDVAGKKSYSVGLHLNLTEGYPIGVSSFESSLTNEWGEFLAKADFASALANGLISDKDLKLEITEQIRAFRRISHDHNLPVHIDGHQHVHVLPEVSRILDTVLDDLGMTNVSIRYPFELLSDVDWVKEENLQFYRSVSSLATACQSFFNKYRHPDGFIGMSIMGSNMTLARLRAKLEETYNYLNSTLDKDVAVVELMVHPGYKSLSHVGGCGFLGPDQFSMSVEREHELNLLKSPEFSEILEELGIQLAHSENVSNFL
ncbi:DgyrCDS13627 [Dimorphilus gyrociliatus]|uniref:Carbohydrate deacetylase n=1 Tax=Dimorphilus gyrociliatus TaxID=2664684 RepID=A0A7I8WB71_9ANNE|nr:DgyrCDS13627 [Dimorphilus gyrociliatus]